MSGTGPPAGRVERPPRRAIRSACHLFDRLERVFNGVATRRAVAAVLVATFAISLVVVELGRRGVFSARVQAALPAWRWPRSCCGWR